MKHTIKKIISFTLATITACSCYLLFGGTVKKDDKRMLAESVAYNLFNYNEEFDELPQSVQQEILNANSASGENDYSIDSYNIKGLDGEEDYILVTGENYGYAVFDKESMQLLEYSRTAEDPFCGIDKDKSYYGGLAGYYTKKTKDSFTDLRTKSVITSEKAAEISSEVKEVLSVKQKDMVAESGEISVIQPETSAKSNFEPGNEEDIVGSYAYHIVSRRLIKNYQYFELLTTRGMFHLNNDGSCSTVATQILLGYNNWANDGRLITNTDYYERQNNIPYSSGNIGTKEAFFQELYSYIDPLENGAFLFDAKRGIRRYLNKNCSEIASQFDYDYHYSSSDSAHNAIKQEIDNNRPLILSVSYYDDEGKEGHSIVGYGYQTVKINGVSNEGYIAHFGWYSAPSDVWFNKSWVKGYLYFRPTHTHSDVYVNSTDTHIVKCAVCDRISTTPVHYLSGSPQLIERNTSRYGQVTDDKYHSVACICGYKSEREHMFTYSYYIEDSHSAICECGFRKQEEHFFKVGKICYRCSYVKE